MGSSSATKTESVLIISLDDAAASKPFSVTGFIDTCGTSNHSLGFFDALHDAVVRKSYPLSFIGSARNFFNRIEVSPIFLGKAACSSRLKHCPIGPIQLAGTPGYAAQYQKFAYARPAPWGNYNDESATLFRRGIARVFLGHPVFLCVSFGIRCRRPGPAA